VFFFLFFWGGFKLVSVRSFMDCLRDLLIDERENQLLNFFISFIFF